MTYFLVGNIANIISTWMNNILWLPIQNIISLLVPKGFWNDLLIGNYGVLTLGFANAITTVLPILSVFFVLYSILEDIGYIPNLTVLTRRIFAYFGLTGGAIIPIVLGFGCKTMATLTTKTLYSKRERFIAIFLIGFTIPCAAQMGVNLGILGRLGIKAFLITFGFIMFVGIASGLLLNRLLEQENKSSFIQELPAMRLPSLRAIIKKTHVRLYSFFKEAVPMFIYSALILFTLDRFGILLIIHKILSPIIEVFLGLPATMADVFILALARREAAAGFMIKLVDSGQLNYIQSIVAVVLNTMFAPCFANIGAMVKELGTKRAIFMVSIINIAAIILSGILYWSLVIFFK
ncbi:MAG: ferrous iron transporter B [Nitrospinae bacterium]|nr:ferrous iron transporter B [Nitrospinota bacterium]